MASQNRMSRTAAALAAATLAVVISGPAGAQATRIEPRIMLSELQLARLQAIANEGPDALRRYLWRTRMIHNWRLEDLVVVM